MAYYGSRRLRHTVVGGVLALFRLLRFALVFVSAALAQSRCGRCCQSRHIADGADRSDGHSADC